MFDRTMQLALNNRVSPTGHIAIMIVCWAFATITVLFATLPLFYRPDYKVPAYLIESGFLEKLADQGFSQVNLVGAWVALILLLDLILETSEQLLSSAYFRSISRDFYFDLVMRLLFLLSLGVPLTTLYAAPKNDHLIVLAFFSRYFQNVTCISMALVSLCDTFDRSRLQAYSTFTMAVVFSVTSLVSYFGFLATNQTEIIQQVSFASQVLYWITFLFICIRCIHCWSELFRRIWHDGRGSILPKEWMYLLYSTLFGFFIIVVFALRGRRFSVYQNATVMDLRLFNGSWIAYAVVATLIPARVARYNARKVQHALIDTKRDVSSLLNDPLKTVQMHLSDMLQSRELLTTMDGRYLQQLEGMAAACDATIDKLVQIVNRDSDSDAETLVDTARSGGRDWDRDDRYVGWQQAGSSILPIHATPREDTNVRVNLNLVPSPSEDADQSSPPRSFLHSSGIASDLVSAETLEDISIPPHSVQPKSSFIRSLTVALPRSSSTWPPGRVFADDQGQGGMGTELIAATDVIVKDALVSDSDSLQSSNSPASNLDRKGLSQSLSRSQSQSQLLSSEPSSLTESPRIEGVNASNDTRDILVLQLPSQTEAIPSRSLQLRQRHADENRLQSDRYILDALANSELLQLQGELFLAVEVVVDALCTLGLAPVSSDDGAEVSDSWEIIVPVDICARLSCALCLKRLGALYRAQDRFDVAESTLQASIRLLSDLPGHTDELAHAYCLLAGLLGTLEGRSAEARRADHMSISLSTKVASNKEEPSTDQYSRMRALARLHTNVTYQS